MEIQKVFVSEYRKIAQRNEYFLWSFLQREQNSSSLTMWSVFDPKINTRHKNENQLLEFLKIFPVNFYESFVDESVDFLCGMGIKPELLYQVPTDDFERISKTRNSYYNPCIILFKKYTMIESTFDGCYCLEGLTKMLLKNSPEILEKAKLD